MAERPEVDTAEFEQSKLEKAVRAQCELHGWGAAVSVANPVDILILFEEEDSEYNINFKIPVNIKIQRGSK